MTIELSKKDLISLVKGTEPYYSIMNNALIASVGKYSGGFHDQWDWNGSALALLSEEQLYEIYKLCKESWIK